MPIIGDDTSLEDLQDFLCRQIKHQNPVILGSCYGGILAQEVCKKIPGSTAIVVSSIIHKNEIPLGNQLAGRMFLLIPSIVLMALGRTMSFIINRVFRRSVKIPRVWQKSSQNKFIIKHPFDFVGIERSRIFRIHGTRDKVVPILPEALIEKPIDGRGHFMFFQNKHKDVLLAINEAAESFANRS